MSISATKFSLIKHRWGAHSSWAVWQNAIGEEFSRAHMNDTIIVEPTEPLLNSLHTDIIFIALNMNDDDTLEPFRAFHDSDPRSMEYKLRHAFKDTILHGSYMTHIFQNAPTTDPDILREYLAANPQYLQSSISRLREELEDVCSSDKRPLLIAIGAITKVLLDQYFSDDYEVVAIPHYDYKIMSATLYRERVQMFIDEHHLYSPAPARLEEKLIVTI